jgi:hypothetical protein
LKKKRSHLVFKKRTKKKLHDAGFKVEEPKFAPTKNQTWKLESTDATKAQYNRYTSNTTAMSHLDLALAQKLSLLGHVCSCL